MEHAAALIVVLEPLTRAVAEQDLSDPAAAQALASTIAPEDTARAAAALREAWESGWLTPRRASEEVAFGRVAKAGDATLGFSLDAVALSGVGAPHGHPRGEVSFCLVLSGEPRFDGHPAGWVVRSPGSHHAPTVTGGRMLIVYWLPGGAVDWGSPSAIVP